MLPCHWEAFLSELELDGIGRLLNHNLEVEHGIWCDIDRTCWFAQDGNTAPGASQPWDDEKIVSQQNRQIMVAIVFCSLKVEPFHREVRSTGFPK